MAKMDETETETEQPSSSGEMVRVVNYTKAPIIWPPLAKTQFGQVALLPGANEVSADYLLAMSTFGREDRAGKLWAAVQEQVANGLISDPMESTEVPNKLGEMTLAEAKAAIQKEGSVRQLRRWRELGGSKAMLAAIDRRLTELNAG